jgi:hypothetical protein
MKKLNKMLINPNRNISHDEMLTLKGGSIDKGYLTCRVDGVICWESTVFSCDYAREACDNVCGPWTEAICTGF